MKWGRAHRFLRAAVSGGNDHLFHMVQSRKQKVERCNVANARLNWAHAVRAYQKSPRDKGVLSRLAHAYEAFKTAPAKMILRKNNGATPSTKQKARDAKEKWKTAKAAYRRDAFDLGLLHGLASAYRKYQAAERAVALEVYDYWKHRWMRARLFYTRFPCEASKRKSDTAWSITKSKQKDLKSFDARQSKNAKQRVSRGLKALSNPHNVQQAYSNFKIAGKNLEHARAILFRIVGVYGDMKWLRAAGIMDHHSL